MITQLPTEPGEYEGISDAAYHASNLCSNSTLGMMNPDDGKCPALLEYKRSLPAEPPLATPHSMSAASMDIGTAFHTLMLQPECIDDAVVLLPAVKSYASAAAREQWIEIRDANPGKVFLKPDVWDKVRGMRDAVWEHHAHARTRDILALKGPRELTVINHMHGDSGTPVLCKARIDQRAQEANLIIDWKTTRDASPKGFGKSIANFRYYRQAAFYSDMSDVVITPDFMFVAVETEPPYLPGYYELEPAAIIEGRSEYMRLLDLYAECEQSGVWSGYCQDIQPINLPAWAFK